MSSISLITNLSPNSQITSSSISYRCPNNNNNNTSLCNDSGIVEDSDVGCTSPLQFLDETPTKSNNETTRKRRTTSFGRVSRHTAAENISSTRKVKSYPFESAGLRHRVTVENSSVIVSRLEAVSLSTGARMTLFKCHLCGKMFGRLGELQTHLTAHSEHCLTLFQCRLCDTNFPFKTKLIRHLRLRHRINIPPKVEIPDVESSTVYSNRNRAGVVDTTTTHDDSRIGNTTFSSTCSQSGLDSTFASSLPSKDIVSKDNNENILSRHYDSNATSPQSGCEFNGRTSQPMCVPLDELRDVSQTIFDETSVWCEQDLALNMNSAKEMKCNRTTIHRKKFVCRSCGAQFKKRRSLYQHCVQFHKCVSMIDLSPVKKQVHRDDIGAREVTSNHISNDGVLNSTTRIFQSPESITQPDCEEMLNVVKTVFQRGDDPWSRNISSNYTRPADVHHLDDRSAPRNYDIGESTTIEGIVADVNSSEQIHAVISTSDEANSPTPTHDTELTTAADRFCDSSAKHSTDTADEIRSAPIKSILSPTQFRPKRRHSTTTAVSSQSTAAVVVKPDEEGSYYRDATANSVFFPSSQNFSGLGSMMSGAPFNLSDVSPLLRGGYLPLPLISLFLSQSALASSTLLSGAAIPGSFFCGGGGSQISQQQQLLQSGQMCNDKESMESEERGELSMDHTSQFSTSPMVSGSKSNDTVVAPLQYDGDGEDMMTTQAADTATDTSDWRASLERRMKGFTAKGTSLSKTQSRLYVVPEPVKRTEAFKPILMTDGQTVYRCTYCNKDFSTVSDINRHMDFHEDIRPYKCSHCDYHARTNSQLKVHNMRHQGIRKFQCCLCNYKGVTQSDLNRHAKSQIHVLKSRNQCGSCGEGFVSPVNLGKHFHERHAGGVISSSSGIGGGVKTEI